MKIQKPIIARPSFKLSLRQDLTLCKSVIRRGEGSAISRAGTAKVPAVLRQGSRTSKNTL